MKKSIASGAKRGSVGTLILEALSTSDKYGWEIMKAIEEKSNGEFILKEPSLYSSLKRMETYGLITSYWQDSDIGGRRHYYNLTQMGKEKLNNSSISWSEEKQFVNELFTDDNGAIKPTTSTVDTSIQELNKSVQKVQQTVNKLTQNEKNIEKFIAETEKQENAFIKEETKKPLVEQPVKTGNGIIFPTVSPLQQDIFSVLSVTPQEPIMEKVVAIEEKEEELVQPKEEIVKETEKPEEQSAVFHSFEEQPVSSENVTEATKQDETIKQVVEPVKKEKYTSTPSTYVQMPMFEHEKGISLSGLHIEKEQIDEEKVALSPTPTKPNSIQYLRSLATEKDFLDLKNSFKNKHKSFLNKTSDYQPNFNYKTDTNLENSDSLYGAFDLQKEEKAPSSLSNFKFNNLGLEETRKAKVDADSAKEEQETACENSPFETKDTPISALNKVASINTDNIDYKSIMGELFVDDEKKETTSIKDLPRINVLDNVNVSLKVKKPVDTLKVAEEKPSYSYSFDQFDNKPIENEKEVNTEYDFMVKPHTELKNFHENLSNDAYSSNLLDDIYLKDIKIRIHKTEQKTPFIATNYVSINKLNFNLSFAVFVLMLIQIICTYVGLSNASFINATANTLFVGAGALSCIPFLTTAIIYLLFPLRKKEVNYSLTSKLANNFIVLLITLVFIYAVNLFIGMNSLNTMDFIATWLLPAVLSINLLLIPIIKFILLKRKKYYL